MLQCMLAEAKGQTFCQNMEQSGASVAKRAQGDRTEPSPQSNPLITISLSTNLFSRQQLSHSTNLQPFKYIFLSPATFKIRFLCSDLQTLNIMLSSLSILSLRSGEILMSSYFRSVQCGHKDIQHSIFWLKINGRQSATDVCITKSITQVAG